MPKFGTPKLFLIFLLLPNYFLFLYFRTISKVLISKNDAKCQWLKQYSGVQSLVPPTFSRQEVQKRNEVSQARQEVQHVPHCLIFVPRNCPSQDFVSTSHDGQSGFDLFCIPASLHLGKLRLTQKLSHTRSITECTSPVRMFHKSYSTIRVLSSDRLVHVNLMVKLYYKCRERQGTI